MNFALAVADTIWALFRIMISGLPTGHSQLYFPSPRSQKWSSLDSTRTKLMSVSLFFILIRTLDKPIGTAVARTQTKTPLKDRYLTKMGLGRFAKSSKDDTGESANILTGDFVQCLRALEELHVPVTRDFMVQYEQVDAMACSALSCVCCAVPCAVPCNAVLCCPVLWENPQPIAG